MQCLQNCSLVLYAIQLASSHVGFENPNIAIRAEQHATSFLLECEKCHNCTQLLLLLCQCSPFPHWCTNTCYYCVCHQEELRLVTLSPCKCIGEFIGLFMTRPQPLATIVNSKTSGSTVCLIQVMVWLFELHLVRGNIPDELNINCSHWSHTGECKYWCTANTSPSYRLVIASSYTTPPTPPFVYILLSRIIYIYFFLTRSFTISP